jgi:hypothetical protein
MKLFWEQVGVYFVVYGVFLIFFGILGAGSLNYFAVTSGASETRLREFLDSLRFPFKTLIEVYYGAPQEKVVSVISKATPKSAMAMRFVGGLFPILFIVASIFNFISYEHSLLETVASLGFSGLVGLTILVMWRFGHRLTQMRR